MSETVDSFDKEYVTKLREEAAQWRTKYRELEAQGLYKDVQLEFAKRGIEADPSWVVIAEGQSIKDAVDGLVAKHPNLSAPTPVAPTLPIENTSVRRVQVPSVMSAGPANSDTPPTPFKDRSPAEIKKDPVARSKLRDQYRALLASSSNQPNHEYNS